jgi:hypothetical protein
MVAPGWLVRGAASGAQGGLATMQGGRRREDSLGTSASRIWRGGLAAAALSMWSLGGE